MKLTRNIFLLPVVFILFGLAVSAQPRVINATDKYAKYGDIKVHYQDQGKGKTALIYVHGWACNLNFWKGQFAALPGKRMIFIDLPGHGKSDKPQAAYTMEYFARSVEAVMRDSGVKKAVLIGHSMGTQVIRNFYKLYPDKTSALILVDGSLRPYGSKEEGDKFLAQMKSGYQTVVPGFIDMMTVTAQKETRDEIRNSMMATPQYVSLSAMESLIDEKSYPQEKIAVPVMAILADSGQWPGDTEEYLRSVTTTLKFHKWQGVSHFLMMEKPQVFNQAVGIFVSSNNLL